MGNYAEAARSFDAASTYDKENPKYALNLARTLEKLGQLDDARAVYERAEELAPEDPRLLEDHAEFYMQVRECLTAGV
jgi:Flp pilus assembly protein TadD